MIFVTIRTSRLQNVLKKGVPGSESASGVSLVGWDREGSRRARPCVLHQKIILILHRLLLLVHERTLYKIKPFFP